jgi:hypothetical protein
MRSRAQPRTARICHVRRDLLAARFRTGRRYRRPKFKDRIRCPGPRP